MLRFLPLLLLIVLVISASFAYLPIRREIVYKLGISGDTTQSCCNADEITQGTGQFDENASIAQYDGEIVDYPKTSLAKQYDVLAQIEGSQSNVLGTKNAAGEDKWIEVSLDQQMLRAWEGSKVVMEFAISSGKWFKTPTGDFNIWYKTRAQKMEGGSKELHTYYNLPNVPHNMFFFKGFAIHGAYWHNNFGHPMSHGCVNAPLDKVAELFEWTGPVLPPGTGAVRATAENPGTRVYVH